VSIHRTEARRSRDDGVFFIRDVRVMDKSSANTNSEGVCVIEFGDVVL
jgi:hypothetical protein